MHRPAFLRYNHSSQQRLGALKVFVALLDPQRRSIGTEVLDRKILALLVGPPSPSAHVTIVPPKRNFPNNRGEELLMHANAPSLLFTVTKKMLSRVREWAKLLNLVGNGNQITERGLMLQRLMGDDQVGTIRRGQFAEQNPFRLSLGERLFFLYTLLEHDGIWPFLLSRIGDSPAGTIITSAHACKLTTLSFLDQMDVPGQPLSGAEILQRREMRELTVHMAKSLNLDDSRIAQIVSPPRGPQRVASRKRIVNAIPQRNTADDQAIPRFENLVDLGFLAKSTDTDTSIDELVGRRLEWRYVVKNEALQWKACTSGWKVYDSSFLWAAFAGCAAKAMRVLAPEALTSGQVAQILPLLETEYRRVHRSLGHTPLESLALSMMIKGLEQGLICEMSVVHELFLKLKSDGHFGDHLKFASGNELDRMFIDLRPGFFHTVRQHYAQ